MSGPNDLPTPTATRRHCRVEGCTCEDRRIVSTRRAAFFAVVARSRGETADRVIAPEPGWAIPADVAAD